MGTWRLAARMPLHPKRRVVSNLSKEKADDNVVRQVQEQKDRLASLGLYNDRPDLSLVVLSFNNRKNLATISKRLHNTSADEIIVCEDRSVEGSLNDWVSRLDRPNDFLLRSNDLHEIRADDRAIRLACGHFVAVMQDDDIPPQDGH